MSEQKKGTEILEIELPNGELIEMEVPSGASPEAIRAAVNKMRGLPSATGPVAPTPVPKGLQIAPQPQPQGQGALRRLAGGLFLDPLIGLKDLGLKQVAEKMPTPMDAANPINALRVGGGMLHDITQGIVTSQMDAGQEYMEKAASGDALGNVSRFLEAGVPLLGPLARSIRKDAEAGNYAGAIGQTGGLLLGLRAPAAASAAKTAEQAAIKQSFNTAVKELPDKVMKAIKPSISIRKQFSEVSPIALDDAVSFAKTGGKKVDSVGDLYAANTGSRKAIFEDIQKLSAQGVSLDGDAIAAQLRKFKKSYDVELIDKATGKPIATKQPGLSPADFSEIDNAISLFEGKMVPLEVAENMRRGVNARLSSFMRKNDIRKGQELKSNPATAGNAELADILAKEADSTLGKIKSPAMTPLRKRYSASRTLDDALTERIIREMTDEEVGLLDFQSLDTITFGSAFTAAATGNIPAAATLGLTGTARRVIDVISDRLNKPDAQISRAFSEINKNMEMVKPFQRVSAPERRALPPKGGSSGEFLNVLPRREGEALGLSGPKPPPKPKGLLPAIGGTSPEARTVFGPSQFGIQLPSKLVNVPEPPSVARQLTSGKEPLRLETSSSAYRKGPADIGPDAPLEARLDQMLGLNRPPRPENVRLVKGKIEVWTGKKWKEIAELSKGKK